MLTYQFCRFQVKSNDTFNELEEIAANGFEGLTVVTAEEFKSKSVELKQEITRWKKYLLDYVSAESLASLNGEHRVDIKSMTKDIQNRAREFRDGFRTVVTARNEASSAAASEQPLKFTINNILESREPVMIMCSYEGATKTVRFNLELGYNVVEIEGLNKSESCSVIVSSGTTEVNTSSYYTEVSIELSNKTVTRKPTSMDVMMGTKNIMGLAVTDSDLRSASSYSQVREQIPITKILDIIMAQ